MAIKLRVVSDHHHRLGETRSRVFGVNGGTIGRAPDCDWVLPDPKRLVSGHHCEIEYHGGGYWLRDVSTNGVFVNESEDPASITGPVELHDGDRLRIGDYELKVNIDSRIDFLPSEAEETSARRHLDSHIGANLDVDSLLSPREPGATGSVRVRSAFVKASQREAGEIPPPAVAHPPPAPAPRGSAAAALLSSEDIAVDLPAWPRPGAQAVDPEWAESRSPIARHELADAVARRQNRIEARQPSPSLQQQASAWGDLRSAVQAFCRGAGIDPGALSAEAQNMLPLVVGQLLREAIVGLNDLAQSRAQSTLFHTQPQPRGSNPLRTSSSVEQALTRLLQSQGRLAGGPVDALRDVLQETKDHEIAVQAAMRAGLETVLGQLAPANVADQFEQGRARTLAPGQDPRPKYWEHYAELFRVVTQHLSEGVPHPFAEAFASEYDRAREELRAGRRGKSGN
jgi:type VI secretion system FHA domain protein